MFTRIKFLKLYEDSPQTGALNRLTYKQDR